jgi:two-component system chemotaxis response regulator CheY
MKQILVVDDSSTARSIIKRSLEMCGVEDINIREANNGIEALSILKTEAIDIVFTDLNMPELNGEQLLKRIKSSPKLFDIPVIIITSLNNPANEQRLLDEHATAVLSKPLALPAMHKVLSENLQLV